MTKFVPVRVSFLFLLFPYARVFFPPLPVSVLYSRILREAGRSTACGTNERAYVLDACAREGLGIPAEAKRFAEQRIFIPPCARTSRAGTFATREQSRAAGGSLDRLLQSAGGQSRARSRRVIASSVCHAARKGQQLLPGCFARKNPLNVYLEVTTGTRDNKGLSLVPRKTPSHDRFGVRKS